LKSPFNIILPSIPISPKRLLALRCPHQGHVCTFPVPQTYYLSSPSHSFDLFTRITFGEDKMFWYEVRNSGVHYHLILDFLGLFRRRHCITPESYQPVATDPRQLALVVQ
jgi:hypothetical protein